MSTLTSRIVKLFKLQGFFGFETLERARQRRSHNKFTRYGAARYHGRLDTKSARRAHDELRHELKSQKKK